MSDIQKWLVKLPGILTLLMVITLGVTLANLLWMILTPPTAVAEAASLRSPDQAITTSRKENYGKLIADQHIFGAAPKATPKAIKAPSTPKKVAPKITNLNLKLTGIIASKTGLGGFAMLSYNGKNQEVYKLGDAIPKQEEGKARELNGVFLTFIGDKYVLVDNNGTEQKVELPELGSGKSGASARSKTPQTSSTRLKPRPISSNTNTPKSPSGGGQIPSLTELRDKALQDPSVLMSVVTPSIVRKNGEVAGIRVYPGSNRRLFRQLGLKNGDIITQVNGILIDSPNKGMEIFQQLSGASSLSITVLRGGNEHTLNPNF
ncbi:MAG: hypothetical protein CSB47_01075 [Proteobacteria bacterium]|nr:MAG: hypothetical protein CSB47_01075 [Pseudomonadota bacterium]